MCCIMGKNPVMVLNSNTSVNTPETCDFMALRHPALVTVHGGNHCAKLAALTEFDTECFCLMWSTQSCGVPFHVVHHVTGHHHNWAKSRLKLAKWRTISFLMTVLNFAIPVNRDTSQITRKQKNVQTNFLVHLEPGGKRRLIHGGGDTCASGGY